MKTTWTEKAIRALGVRTDVPTAGAIVAGWCRTEAYDAVKRGDFPVPVVRVGRRLVVPVAPILELLRLGPPDTATAGTVPPDPAAVTAAAPTPRTRLFHDDTSGH